MKRIHLKKKKKVNMSFVIIMLISFTFSSVYFVSERITPVISDLAEIKINKFSTTVINKAVSQVLEENIGELDLFDTIVGNDGSIDMVDFNPIAVNHILSLATTVVLNNLKLLEVGDLESVGIETLELSDEDKLNLEKGIVALIPIGSATRITLLSNLGPKIPIKLHYTGDVNSNITTKITQYGINNALIEIILPFSTSIKTLENDVPIAIKMIQGKIPSYYNGYVNKNSDTYTLPNN